MTASNQLPPEVLSYQPSAAAIKTGSGEKGLRHIFGDQPLDAFEEGKIAGFRVLAKERKVSFSDTLFSEDRYLLRFLQGNHWRLEETLTDVLRHLEWRKRNIPVPMDLVKDELPKGCIYLHGRDRGLRPVMIFRGTELAKFEHDKALQVVFHWLEFVVANLLVRNRVEQWRVIVDLSDVWFYNAPMVVLKDVAMSLQQNYRGRLCQLTFINTPLVFWGVWQAISYMLPEHTSRKINIVTSDFNEFLPTVIRPNQLEEKYGGTCPNVTRFDQPSMPQGPFCDAADM